MGPNMQDVMNAIVAARVMGTNTQDVMLDIETFGSKPGSVIVAIGAVKMDLAAGTVGDSFYRDIDPASSQRLGLTIDARTVIWWMGQSDDARLSIVQPNQLALLPEALRDFAVWIGPDTNLWGNGSDFDNVLLGAAYDACLLERPWSHSRNRCYRTLKSLFPDVKLIRYGTHHHALQDAVTQADHLCQIMQAMRGSIERTA